MAIASVSDDEFFALVKRSEVFTVVDFTATWCGPCKRIAPTFEELASTHRIEDAIEFISVDVDACPSASSWARVTAMPTFHVYKNNVKVSESVGANSSALTQMVEDLTTEYKSLSANSLPIVPT